MAVDRQVGIGAQLQQERKGVPYDPTIFVAPGKLVTFDLAAKAELHRGNRQDPGEREEGLSIDLDQAVDIADAVATLTFLFSDGQAPACPDAADANDDGQINLADPIAMLTTLFSPETVIAPPFPEAGPDPTGGDGLGTCYR